jgi:hypothetical protein
MKKVNVNTIKNLVPVCPNRIKHFCSASARLVGKTALREQLRYEDATKTWSSFESVEIDRDKLKKEIIKTANEAAKSLARLNAIAERKGYSKIFSGLNEVSIGEFITVISQYIDELIDESVNEEWAKELLEDLISEKKDVR